MTMLVSPVISGRKFGGYRSVVAVALSLALCCTVAVVSLRGQDASAPTVLGASDVRSIDKAVHAEERGEEEKMHQILRKERGEGELALQREAEKKQQLASAKAQGALGRYDDIMQFGDEQPTSSFSEHHEVRDHPSMTSMQSRLHQWEASKHQQQQLQTATSIPDNSLQRDNSGQSVSEAASATASFLSRVVANLASEKGDDSQQLAAVLRGDISQLSGFEHVAADQQNTQVRAGVDARVVSGADTEQHAPSVSDAGIRQDSRYPSMQSMESKLREWEREKNEMKEKAVPAVQEKRVSTLKAVPPADKSKIEMLRKEVASTASLFHKELLTEQSRSAQAASIPSGSAGCVELSNAYKGHPVMLEAACSKVQACVYDFGKQDCLVRA